MSGVTLFQHTPPGWFTSRKPLASVRPAALLTTTFCLTSSTRRSALGAKPLIEVKSRSGNTVMSCGSSGGLLIVCADAMPGASKGTSTASAKPSLAAKPAFTSGGLRPALLLVKAMGIGPRTAPGTGCLKACMDFSGWVVKKGAWVISVVGWRAGAVG